MGKGVSFQDLISIIVPVYNTEKYLDRCIQSVLAQTYTNWELLLIDDGSTDSSGMICTKYADKDNRIRVFLKENEGVSATRNYAIERICGEYVVQVDADDWVESDMLEGMYKKIKECQADMVICDFFEEYRDQKKTRYVSQRPSSNDTETILEELFQHLHGSCCNKLIRSRCYKDFNVRYPGNLNFGEDLYVVVSLLKNPIKVSYLPVAYYHYVKDASENSLVKSADLAILKERMKMFEALTKGYPFHTVCMSRMAFAIASHAFNDGKMSSKEYANTLKPYKRWITISKPYLYGYNTISRLRLFLSCVGLYRLMYWLLTIRERCKKIL